MNYLPCPKCGAVTSSSVIDSRTGQGTGPAFIRRRRVCRLCATRFTTHETIVQKPAPVVPVELDVTGMSLPEIGNELLFHRKKTVGLSAHGQRYLFKPDQCAAAADAFYFAHSLTLKKLQQQTSVPIKK